ncbi:hypothetical protein [Methylocella sp.]|jgi:hypothetical protein|uniref:hypothetical protein n=1 Tax=Methylocella sp. TaxID=1978226 RepID=UPI003C1A5650
MPLTAARVRELFDYDPESGSLTRLVRVSQNTRVGDVVGSLKRGYLVVNIGGRF